MIEIKSKVNLFIHIKTDQIAVAFMALGKVVEGTVNFCKVNLLEGS